MSITHGIKNIIFDWGGVIIDIDYERTKNAFVELGIKNIDKHFSKAGQDDLFDRLDVGQISGEEFFRGIREKFELEAGTGEIREAWNAMLLDFPDENFHLLKKLRSKYRTFLFSNTNEPHLEYYFPKVEKQFGIPEVGYLFEKAYYSCRYGMRKPDPAAFEGIIKENDLIPSETLFIDDSPQHIEGARRTGLKTYHFRDGDRLKDLFTEDIKEKDGN